MGRRSSHGEAQLVAEEAATEQLGCRGAQHGFFCLKKSSRFLLFLTREVLEKKRSGKQRRGYKKKRMLTKWKKK